MYLEQTQQQDVSAFPQVVFGFFLPIPLHRDRKTVFFFTIRRQQLISSKEGKGWRENRDWESDCAGVVWCCVAYAVSSCGLWIARMIYWSIFAMKRLREARRQKWVHDIRGWHAKHLSVYPFCFCLRCPKSAITEIACGLFRPTASESATVTHRLGSECLSVVVALSFCAHENSIVQMGDSSPHCAAVTLVSLSPAL